MTTTFLDVCEVERIDHGHDDLTVVNAARVSNGRRVEELVTRDSPEDEIAFRKSLGMNLDDSLIGYLARNGHWTPFAHVRFGYGVILPLDFDWSAFLNWAGDETRSAGFTWRVEVTSEEHVRLLIHGSLYGWLRSWPPLRGPFINAIHRDIQTCAPLSYAALDPANGQRGACTLGPIATLPSDSWTFRIRAPLTTFRQLMRSNVGVVYNETSRRYVSDEPEIYVPDRWRSAPDKSVKQGSGSPLDEVTSARVDERYTHHVEDGVRLYEDLLGMDVAPEMARFHLPQSMITELWMTATAPAIRRVLKLRLGDDGGKNHPQREIVELATALVAELPADFPRG